MAFDVRTFHAAHEPWSFTDAQGRVWQPRRELSAPAAGRWLARIDLIQDEITSGRLSASAAIDRWLSVTRRIVRSLFPWRPVYWLTGDPVRAFDQLDLEARRRAIDDLFRSREQRTSTPLPRPTQTIRSSGSRPSPRTPTATPLSTV